MRYILWIEGLSPKTGEKIKTLNKEGHTYTNRMGEALRVDDKDLKEAFVLLGQQGVSDWSLKNIAGKTSYTPKGTLFKSLKK